MTDPRWLDPEIDELFAGEPELAELAGRLRAARPEPASDPRFAAVLRASLMREAESVLRPAAARGRGASVPGLVRRSWWRRPAPLAWGGAGIGVALVAAAALVLFTTRIADDRQVTAQSTVAELHAVSTGNIITVAFNEPMNQAAVVAGLHIRPATQVSTRWSGNSLQITPTHRLAGNTPYTVTIDRSAARSASGATPPADIHISFGTAPTPPPATTVATLDTTALGPVNDSAQLIAGPAGGLIVTSSTAAAEAPPSSPSASPSAAASASPSPHPSPSASPSARQSPSPSASPSPTGAAALPAGGNRLILFGTHGAVDLGPAASSAALSADGQRLIAAVASGSGSQIVLASLGSKTTTVLATVGVRVLATGWLSNDTAVVAEPDRIVSVDLQGHVSTVTTLPGGTTTVVFAPGGGAAYAGNGSQDGHLVALSGGSARALPGSRTVVAFSGDGGTVAWIDGSQSTPRLVTSPVDREAIAAVPLDHPAASVADLALDHDGKRLAVVDQPGSSDGQLDVVALPSGTVIARGPAASNPVFTGSNDQLAFVTGGQAVRASVPGGTSLNQGTVLPDGAAGVLEAFIQAQTAADHAAVKALAPSLDVAGQTPPHLTRAYVISAALNGDGTVSATGRLIVDASTERPLASFADETMTLTPSSGETAYVVTALTVAPLHDEPVGPHVVHVNPTSNGGKLVLEIAFDSDLRGDTVGPTIRVTTRGGRALTATTVYDADRRTAVVTLTVASDTPVTLTVGTGVVDVDGQSLASAFTTNTGG